MIRPSRRAAHGENAVRLARLPLRLLAPAIGVALLAGAVLLPWAEVSVALGRTSPGWLAAACLAHVLILPLWVLQWQLLARPFARIGLGRMTEVVALSIGAKVALSGAVGVASGVAGLMARAGLTATAAGSVMAADQLLAAAMKVAVALLALRMAAMPMVIWTAGAGVALAALGGGLAVALARGWLRLPHPMLALLRDLAHLGGARVIPAALALAVAKKTTEVMAAWAVQIACGLDAGPGGALLAVLAVSLSTLLPVMPANLGTHAAAVAGAYMLLGHPAPDAISAGLVHHATLLASSGAIVAGTALAGRRARRLREAGP